MVTMEIPESIAVYQLTPRARAWAAAGLLFSLGAAGVALFGSRALEAVRGYRSWVREARYVKMRDGTELAVDVYRPARGSKALSEPLPVLLTDYRYQRAILDNGQLRTPLDGSARFRSFINRGYVVAVADLRGSGASFGVNNGPFANADGEDAYDLTEWLAAQPWCSGAVGMFGTSYSGTVQMLAAAAAPPHLKAIFPEMFIFDLYEVAYPGGVPRSPFVRNWSSLVDRLDSDGKVAPVSASGAPRLTAALAQHHQNVTPYQMLGGVPYRDSRDPITGESVFQTRSPDRLLARVNASHIPVYALSGFGDLWPKDALLWFSNLSVPKKITIGPWSHNDRTGLDRTSEQLRWFDHWLKHVDNDVMRQPRVRYYASGARPGWRVSADWPPAAAANRAFLLCGDTQSAKRSSSVQSLCEHAPDTQGRDDYRVDYEATTGSTSRWANGYGADFAYPDLAGNDDKLLTYTGDALTTDLEVTGHPLVRLWITADVPDVDVVLYLEDVERDGSSHYVTEGVLRASHRRVTTPDYGYLSLPFHGSRAADVEPLPPEPSELRIDLLPIAYRFGAGHRIRLAVSGADRDNLETRAIDPPPVFHVYWGGSEHSSSLILPVVPASAVRLEEPIQEPLVSRLSLAAFSLLALFGSLYVAYRPLLRRIFVRARPHGAVLP